MLWYYYVLSHINDKQIYRETARINKEIYKISKDCEDPNEYNIEDIKHWSRINISRICNVRNLEDIERFKFLTHLKYDGKDVVEHFPRSLKHLTITTYQNLPFKKGTLSDSLESLTLGKYYVLEIERDVLPKYLKHLALGEQYNHKLKAGVLPDSLLTLKLGYSYNRKISKGCLPHGLREIIFGERFTECIEEGALPDSLKNVEFYCYYDLQPNIIPKSCNLVIRYPDPYMRYAYYNSTYLKAVFPQNCTHYVLEDNVLLKPNYLPNTVTHLTISNTHQKNIVPNAIPNSVTHIIGYRNIFEVGSLPSNLQSITFDDDFNEPINDMFDTVTELIFGTKFNKEFTCPPNLKHLKFGHCFNQSLEICDTLETLEFGNGYNKDLPKLGNGLKSLKFGSGYKGLIKVDVLPESLEELVFYGGFDQNLEQPIPKEKCYETQEYKCVLPSNLKKLVFGKFDRIIKKGNLQNTLTHLELSPVFNQKLEPGIIPENVEYLSMGDCFNQIIEVGVIPKKVKTLIFGNAFNQKLDKGALPDSLVELTFGAKFNQPLEELIIPDSIERLTFNGAFNKELKKLPNNLKHLQLSWRYNYSIDKVLPEGLEELVFGFGYNKKIDCGLIPKTIKMIKIKKNQRKLFFNKWNGMDRVFVCC